MMNSFSLVHVVVLLICGCCYCWIHWNDWYNPIYGFIPMLYLQFHLWYKALVSFFCRVDLRLLCGCAHFMISTYRITITRIYIRITKWALVKTTKKTLGLSLPTTDRYIRYLFVWCSWLIVWYYIFSIW